MKYYPCISRTKVMKSSTNNYKNPYQARFSRRLNNFEKWYNKEKCRMLYRSPLETLFYNLASEYTPLEERKTIVYTKVLDIPAEHLEVYHESPVNKTPRLVVYNKEENKQLHQFVVPENYTYKVFYKEGVLVIRLDLREPESYLVKVDV